MNAHLDVGVVVRVVNDHRWKLGTRGTLSRPTEENELDLGYGAKVYREIEVHGKQVTMYWVRFVTPQFDIDGEGPFFEAEIAGGDIAAE